MKLKKFEAPTEAQAMEMIRSELGEDALVLNIKKIKPRGLSSIFKKPYVEVSAAYEDKPIVKINNEELKNSVLKTDKKSTTEKENKLLKEEEFKSKIQDTLEKAENEIKIKMKNEEIDELEKKLADAQELLNKALSQLSVANIQSNVQRKYENTMVQFFYDSLIEQEVMPEIAVELLEDIENLEDIESIDINLLVKIVYNKIINIIGEPSGIQENEDKFAKNVIFIGPTGVGKTTTIAKLSSELIINKDSSVGFITSDTYRIAAVEQLKTYAEILDSDVAVVYSPEDMKNEIENLRVVNNYIFIDTAGRSHKNVENVNELKELLAAVDNPCVYLVLSITTKCEDLINIIEAYAQFADFKLILTKLDETLHLGSILNICRKTGREISYISSGQNVPDDLEIVKPEKIAKALLGSMYK